MYRLHRRTSLISLLAILSAHHISAVQHPFDGTQSVLNDDIPVGDNYHKFSHEIQRVAVIGAGPAGLQAAAALLEDGYKVRLFERTDKPGGNWYYREEVPIPASFP